MNEGQIKKVNPRTLPGFMELLPEEQILFNQMEETIRKSYESFGFLPLDTPIIESAEVLLAKTGGDTEKQIYTLRKGDTDLALRFDLTVPLAKYIAINSNKLVFPFRRYQIGKVYRGERPQRGRFREFYQVDIDIVGNEKLDLIYDAEIPSVIYSTFLNMNLGDFTIKINNRKILEGLFDSMNVQSKSVDILRVIDKKDKIGNDKVIEELQSLQISDADITSIMDFINISGTSDEKLNILKSMNINNSTFKTGVQELEYVIKSISKFGVPQKKYTVDLTIARGLDYYTGTVYETTLDQYPDIGSVCSGGRYDNLSEFYTNKKMPGIGISIGLTRLFYQISSAKAIIPDRKSISTVLVVPMINNLEMCVEKSLEIGAFLRNKGINTEVFLADKKFKVKLEYANKLKMPFALIVGEDEIKLNKYSLKNLKTGNQDLLSMDEIVSEINKHPPI